MDNNSWLISVWELGQILVMDVAIKYVGHNRPGSGLHCTDCP